MVRSMFIANGPDVLAVGFRHFIQIPVQQKGPLRC